tara:strand:- start:2819 stop:3034 length:216 start_codon:yes stop_codon:yes gene_type:complete
MEIHPVHIHAIISSALIIFSYYIGHTIGFKSGVRGVMVLICELYKAKSIRVDEETGELIVTDENDNERKVN